MSTEFARPLFDLLVKFWHRAQGVVVLGLFATPVLVGIQLTKPADPLPHGASVVFKVPERGQLRVQALSPDGRFLAAAFSDTATLLVVAIPSGSRQATRLEHDREVRFLAFSAEGDRLIVGDAWGRIEVWQVDDAETWTLAFRWIAHPPGVRLLEVEPDGIGLRTWGFDGRARRWDLRSGALLDDRPIEPTLDLSSLNALLSLDKAGLRVEAAWSGELRLCDAATGRPVRRLLKRASSLASGLAASPDSRRFASTHGDQSIRIWDVATGRLLAILRGHRSRIRAVAWSPDSSSLHSSDLEGTVIAWDLDQFLED